MERIVSCASLASSVTFTLSDELRWLSVIPGGGVARFGRSETMEHFLA